MPCAAPAYPAAAVPAGGLVPALAGSAGVGGARRGACPLCRLPPPAFSFDSAPHPPSPLPRRGRGRFLVFLCKGLRPLHPRAEPGLNGNRKGAPVPSEGLAPVSPARRALAAPCRERLFLPPAAPTFPSPPLCPIPPRRAQAERTGESGATPSPARKKSPAAYTAGLLRRKARITSRWRST